MVANKKQKTEDGSRSLETSSSPLPPYGSQQYWEDRYRKHCTVFAKAVEETGTAKEENPSTTVQDDDDDPLVGHAWYFTYEELRPLILPIIFGGPPMDPNNDNKADDERNSNEENVINVEMAIATEKNKAPPSATLKCGDDVGEEEWVELEEDQSLSDENDSEEEEEYVEREGLGKNGPISIMEIGCGDVPLGATLADELNDLQRRKTGLPAGCVIQRIVCVDYSETVIAVLRKNQKEQQEQHRNDKTTTSTTIDRPKDVPLEYVTADARRLDYPDGSFHFILEKGTLDAMLSDKEAGASNSTLIMTQCARILSVGGYILLVSHLNAHVDNGRRWLDEVIIPGLRAGDCKCSWEIEVHGKEQAEVIDQEAEDEADEDENTNKEDDDGSDDSTSSRSPGPAVYIMHKLPTTCGVNEIQNVSLRLFAY